VQRNRKIIVGQERQGERGSAEASESSTVSFSPDVRWPLSPSERPCQECAFSAGSPSPSASIRICTRRGSTTLSPVVASLAILVTRNERFQIVHLLYAYLSRKFGWQESREREEKWKKKKDIYRKNSRRNFELRNIRKEKKFFSHLIFRKCMI